ncbi:MAG: HEAT repeat domain-containing protein [Planctomycetes bacterium]|nr:HEAT repeat domain-containing protein [Planctomycetota bacterium]
MRIGSAWTRMSPWLSRAITVFCLLVFSGATRAEVPQWIWSGAHKHREVPVATCYFRKVFEMGTPEAGQIEITGDDGYELYVNGHAIGSGSNWKQLDSYDITKYLQPGENVVAAKVPNAEIGAAALVGILTIKEQGHTFVSHSTDGTWKTSLKESAHWQKMGFDDSAWLAAQTLGAFNATAPWGNEVKLAGTHGGRFKVPPDFRVEWVIDPKQTGSLVAMTFNEFGQILASRENGPLLLIYDKDKNGIVDTVLTYCDKVKNCQGILALNGEVLVTGDGPDGAALYRLTDKDHDGKADEVTTLLKFTGGIGEHGAHKVTLGPDGAIYVILGNHAFVEKTPEKNSPHHNYYEGDLLKPKFDDPGGHALGKKAPGGTIIRTDAKGSFVEVFAGGLRNAYAMAFSRNGDLLTVDSDMEWDIGLPWYRPTRVNHVIPGAEFGWRSGWAKWPAYYHDSLPATLPLGQGSPTGVAIYNHVMYPARFHNALFVCDWSMGRIHAVSFKPEQGTFVAQSSVFVEGRPMNVSDIAVAPDGWLYFCTGGRDTEGGIYRIVWSGKVPPAITDIGQGLTAAIRQPQLYSAWSRQKIANIKQKLGDDWSPGLLRVASDTRNRPDYRVRALDLMQIFGPFPKMDLLVKLSVDRNPLVRGKCAYLMGIHADEVTGTRLVAMLDDPSPTVRRKACEALANCGYQPPADKLIELLGSSERYVAWAARRKLEQLPRDQWQEKVLSSKNHREFILGATALLVVHPEKETSLAILDRCGQLLSGFINDPDFIDLLRLVEISLERGKVSGDDVPALRRQLAGEYPSTNEKMNRELVRLLVYMQEPSVTGRMVAVLTGDASEMEKLHLAVNIPFLKTGWTTDQKLAVLDFYEQARLKKGGLGLPRYIANVSRAFFANLNDAERQLVLADGAKRPSSALAVLATLPANPGEAILKQLEQLDGQLASLEDPAAKKLQIGIVAVMGRASTPQSMAYLRDVFENQPQRRVSVAIGLAQDPTGKNWPVLIRSLAVVEGVAAQIVMQRLATEERKPTKPQALREVILCGLKLQGSGGQHAIALLEHWVGSTVGEPDAPVVDTLAAWQKWFAETYPDQPDAKLPVDSRENKWTQRELLSYLAKEGAHGNALRGKLVFTKAQCIKCHRFGDEGQSVGPDLTNVARRFQKRETLQSILFPSHVISDQYASKKIITKDGRIYTGIVAPAGADAIVIVQSDASRVTLDDDEIEAIVPSKLSAMPAGLLNNLTLSEIADLFAYMNDPRRISITQKRGETPK